MHKLKIISVAFLAVAVVVISIILLQPAPSIVQEIPQVETAEEPVPDFKQYEDVRNKKQAFFDYLKPAIEAQNEYFRDIRRFLLGIRAKHIADEEIPDFQMEELAWLIQEYRVDENKSLDEIFDELLRKIDIIPMDLVLVQSANESAWGTSRFATEGYNFFGLWCFVENCGFVPKRRDDGASHEVAKFDDLSSAVYVYMRNLNRHPAYRDLRLIRERLRENQQRISGAKLAEGLTKYSERGDEYVEELQSMIRVNKEFIE